MCPWKLPTLAKYHNKNVAKNFAQMQWINFHFLFFHLKSRRNKLISRLSFGVQQKILPHITNFLSLSLTGLCHILILTRNEN